MKQLVIKDKKYRLNIKFTETWFFILKRITQNFNIFVLIWLNAFLFLNDSKQKKSKTFLITKCLHTINKKRFNKLTVLSRQVFLNKIWFGLVIGIQKINRFILFITENY